MACIFLSARSTASMKAFSTSGTGTRQASAYTEFLQILSRPARGKSRSPGGGAVFRCRRQENGGEEYVEPEKLIRVAKDGWVFLQNEVDLVGDVPVGTREHPAGVAHGFITGGHVAHLALQTTVAGQEVLVDIGHLLLASFGLAWHRPRPSARGAEPASRPDARVRAHRGRGLAEPGALIFLS